VQAAVLGCTVWVEADFWYPSMIAMLAGISKQASRRALRAAQDDAASDWIGPTCQQLILPNTC